MKDILVSLDYQRCKQFLAEHVCGIGSFITKAIQGLETPTGKFYCIANENVCTADIYQFDTAIYNVSPGKWIRTFATGYLQAGIAGTHHLLIEHWMGEVETGFLVDTARPYFLSQNKTIFYWLGTACNQDFMDSIFNRAHGAWALGNWIFLVNARIGHLSPSDKIDETVEQSILQNICMFFVEAYDGQSYIVWVKDGHDELMEDLRLFLR